MRVFVVSTELQLTQLDYYSARKSVCDYYLALDYCSRQIEF